MSKVKPPTRDDLILVNSEGFLYDGSYDAYKDTPALWQFSDTLLHTGSHVIPVGSHHGENLRQLLNQKRKKKARQWKIR